VLEECRNLIVEESDAGHIYAAMAEKSIFRQGTIDTTAPTSAHERTALLENASSHHAGTTPDFCATSSDQRELAQRYTSDSQPVSAVQSERGENTSDLKRHAIYGHHIALADLKSAARSGCQICWQVWDLLSSDMSNISAGLSEAHEAVESAKTHFCTCLLFNAHGAGYINNVDICYDGTESPQLVCSFNLFPETSMYGYSLNCYNR
jgi:hypothetical protein